MNCRAFPGVLQPSHYSMDNLDIEASEKSHKQLTLINQRQEERTQQQETKAATLTVGYVISQGAILISISNRSALQCYDWFVPFSLSLLLGVVYFVTFWEAVNRWYRLQYHLDLNYFDAEALLVQIHHHHHRRPPQSSPEQPPSTTFGPDPVRLMRRKSFIGVLIVALLGFQGVMLYACRSFLCHGF